MSKWPHGLEDSPFRDEPVPVVPQQGPQQDADRIMLDSICDLLAQDRPDGLNWPGVARLIRRALSASRIDPPVPSPLCPTCGSPDRDLHPLTGRDDSEIRMCRDGWHKLVPSPGGDTEAPEPVITESCGCRVYQHGERAWTVYCAEHGAAAVVPSPSAPEGK